MGNIGFPYCYGVFREYFITHEPFKGEEIVSIGGMLANVSIRFPAEPTVFTNA